MRRFPWLRLIALCGAGLLLTASPAAATHVECGDVITTDTRLDSDLTGCTGDALRIDADGVTLDLGGHAITGGVGAIAGVRAAQRDDVVIRNGHISGFFDGVVLDETTGSQVRLVRAEGNVRGIELAGSDDNVVEGNRVRGNALDGIRLGLSSGNEISGNHVEGNVFSISVADGSSENVVTRNTVLRGREGIALFSGGADNVVERNVSHDHQVDGIRVEADVLGTIVERNVTHHNGDDGVDVRAPSGVRTRNVANGNGDLGFFAAPGVTDGGGNRAHANGNPLQCVGIAC